MVVDFEQRKAGINKGCTENIRIGEETAMVPMGASELVEWAEGKSCQKEKQIGSIAVVDTFQEGMGEIVGNIDDSNRQAVFAMGLENIQGALNNALYARINPNEDGDNKIELSQKYSNGAFSPIMTIRQADLIRAWRDEQNAKKGIEDKEAERRTKKFFEKVEDEYYGKLNVNMSEVLDVREIVKLLFLVLDLLPIRKSRTAEMEREEFYKLLKYEASVFDLEEHREFYAFDEDEFEYIAERMKMTKTSLLAKLEKLDLLYLKGTSSAHKTNVRVNVENGDSYTKRKFCVCKIRWIDDDNEDFDRNNF